MSRNTKTQRHGQNRIASSSVGGILYNRSLAMLESGNAEESFELNTQAAQEGLHDAVLAMGWYYLNGVGVEPNIEKAKWWYEKSAKQGEQRAYFSLGEIEYFEKNYDAAKVWFERAIGEGHVKSMYWLGKMYFRGYGLKLDKNAALKLFNEAAQKKFKPAQRVLRWLYREQRNKQEFN